MPAGKTLDWPAIGSAFLIQGQKLTPFWAVKGQIFAKSAIFQIYIIIFQKLSIEATYGFHQRVPRSMLYNPVYRYCFLIEYLWRSVPEVNSVTPISKIA